MPAPTLVAIVFVTVATFGAWAQSLSFEQVVNGRPKVQASKRPICAHEPGFETRVGGRRRQAGAKKNAVPQAERAWQGAAPPTRQLEPESSVPKKRLWACERFRRPLAGTKSSEDLLLFSAFQHHDWVGPTAEDVHCDFERHALPPASNFRWRHSPPKHRDRRLRYTHQLGLS